MDKTLESADFLALSYTYNSIAVFVHLATWTCSTRN